MPNMKKAAAKKSDPSKTKPFNVQLIKPSEIIKDKPKAKPAAKTTTKAPAKVTPKPKVTKKPEKMTPQDAAMKKILEKKYGKIYG
jgi:hypothetical protein